MELSVVIVKPALASVTDSIEVFKSRRQEPVVEVNKFEDAVDLAKNGLPCVVVFSIHAESDIVNCLQLIRSISSERKDKVKRVVVISQIQNLKLSQSLLQRGASDFLPARLAPTAMVFKLALQLNQILRLMQEPAESVMVSGRGHNSTDNGTHAVTGSATGYHSSNEILREDMWFVRGGTPKKVGVQWVTDLEGPDPDSGAWEPMSEEGREERWIWIPIGADGKPDRKAVSTGAWQFSGNRPVFDGESGKWRFVAAKPELAHHNGKTKTGCKIKFDSENGLTLAADNPANYGKIEETQKIGDRVRLERDRQASASVNLPSAQFGQKGGDWETVPNAGWAYVTPEMKEQTPEDIQDQTDIWTLDKKPGTRKPIYEAQDDSWSFSKSPPPVRNEKFDDLPPVYQSYLMNLNPPAANSPSEAVGSLAKSRVEKETSQNLKFFFQLSKMVNEGRTDEEVYRKIIHALCEILKFDQMTMILPQVAGNKRHALIVYSTNMSHRAGTVMDLEATKWPDALTQTRASYHVSAENKSVASFPLIDPGQPKTVHGSLLVEFSAGRDLEKDPQINVLNLASRQLTRLIQRSHSAA